MFFTISTPILRGVRVRDFPLVITIIVKRSSTFIYCSKRFTVFFYFSMCRAYVIFYIQLYLLDASIHYQGQLIHQLPPGGFPGTFHVCVVIDVVSLSGKNPLVFNFFQVWFYIKLVLLAYLRDNEMFTSTAGMI